jgi:hypothetical protein
MPLPVRPDGFDYPPKYQQKVVMPANATDLALREARNRAVMAGVDVLQWPLAAVLGR